MKSKIFLILFTICSTSTFSQTPYFQALVVSNIDTATSWYSKVLKLKLRNRVDSEERGFKQAILHNDKTMVELVELKNMVSENEALKSFPERTRLIGFYKIGFIADDLDECHNRLEKFNVKFYGKTVTDSVSGKRTFLVTDPDGNLVQFFEK